jgi:hypothetical protein
VKPIREIASPILCHEANETQSLSQARCELCYLFSGKNPERKIRSISPSHPPFTLLHRLEFACGLSITPNATGMPSPIAEIYLLEHCETGSGARGAIAAVFMNVILDGIEAMRSVLVAIPPARACRCRKILKR